jgi:phage-related protein
MQACHRETDEWSHIGIDLGSKEPSSKPWKGLGPGVLELVRSHNGNAYRAMYTVRVAQAVYVLHAFQNTSPFWHPDGAGDVELVAARLRTAQQDRENHHGPSTR